RVVDRIGIPARRDLRKIDFVRALRLPDGAWVAGQADQPRMKERHIAGQALWRVSIRVERDEKRLHPVSGFPELLERQTDRPQIGGTHVGTRGKTEIQDEQLAAELRVGPGRTGVIDERKRPADRLAVPHQYVHELRGGTLGRLMR